ncbi:hypothetical protein [Ornithinibacillus halophilus]|uniref:Uncharacterized protein n=1 Tax=Ornithinibacillus halophilus TaxID=930117 RepID=A0A1M5L964_9BACI|nr:hypothetical protein [Ornithinibacillus halophilus]SHG61664.1 hypothetical protein SAMN05216225_104520 [Ornithinibacillus halophilus]
MAIVYSGNKLKDYLVQTYNDISTVKFEQYNLSTKEEPIDILSNANLYFLAKQNPEPIIVECKLFKSAKEVEDYRSKPLKDYEQIVLYEILKGKEVNKYNGFYGQLEIAEFYGNRLNSKEIKKEEIDENAYYMLVEDVVLKIQLVL